MNDLGTYTGGLLLLGLAALAGLMILGGMARLVYVLAERRWPSLRWRKYRR